jgi:hypothetical protein
LSLVINNLVVRRLSELRNNFQSDFPLPRFVIVQDFLDSEALHNAIIGCRESEYETFCGYSPTGEPKDIVNEFTQPNEKFAYATIHQRHVKPIQELVRLRKLLQSKEAMDVFYEMTAMI